MNQCHTWRGSLSAGVRGGRRWKLHESAPAIPASWPELWRDTQTVLRRRGYTEGTLRQYRHILRTLAGYVRTPQLLTEPALRDHLLRLTRKGASWSWTGANISAVRTVFDRLHGMSLTTHLATPRRSWHLPHILSRADVRRVLAACTCTRDQLLLGLMYGCGLKVHEACALTWSNIHPVTGTLSLAGPMPGTTRHLPLPRDLAAVLAEGVARCPGADFIFRGIGGRGHLSARMAAVILADAVRRACVGSPVTCMTLRHSYAVHSIEDGMSIRCLQQCLGHADIRTTLMYRRCLPPAGIESPLDALPTSQDTPAETPSLQLFDQPLSAGTVRLPFEPPTLSQAIVGFYRDLRMRFGRFVPFR